MLVAQPSPDAWTSQPTMDERLLSKAGAKGHALIVAHRRVRARRSGPGTRKAARVFYGPVEVLFTRLCFVFFQLVRDTRQLVRQGMAFFLVEGMHIHGQLEPLFHVPYGPVSRVRAVAAA